MRIFIKAASAQGLVLAMSFFVESIFPLGDWRWLVVAASFALIILATIYFERRDSRIPDKEVRRALDRFHQVIADTETKIDRAMLIDIYRKLMGDKDEQISP